MLWHHINHPCVWFTAADLPRLRHNATLPFWKEKFDLWRSELAEKQRLLLRTPVVDFHQGSNTEALKAALCHVVDGDAHSGRLIASFLEEVVALYRARGATWPLHMTAAYRNEWVGDQWEGLANSHIVDPMVWFSTAHLYDVIYGQGYLAEDVTRDFEKMMGEFHRLCCLHEECSKLDNNRAAWLNGGSYLSTLFDDDDMRAELCRQRARENMEHLLGTFLPDGHHYEIGYYAIATLAAMHMSARLMRNVEGADFFKKSRWGVGLEDACRAWVQLLIPGSALRFPLAKDRINHWDAIMGGYLEYHQPELGWAVSRVADRTWVPMFKHWSQGSEFYFYKEPDNAHEPEFLDSHLTSAGIAVLRESWKPEARSLYFRYGFQGSSHGGGLDKLNFELTCNDEPLISDGGNSEFSHYKNVVLVDGQNQEQCSGKCIASRLNTAEPLQFISALGGFGAIPDCPIFHDPKIEFQYWSTQNEECFPGIARMRRTIAFVQRRYFVIRDTLWSLDHGEHEYQWLFHTFGQIRGLGRALGRESLTYYPKRIYKPMRCVPETRIANLYQLEKPGRFSLHAPRAGANLFMLAGQGIAPEQLRIWNYIGPRHRYAGSPDAGDCYTSGEVNACHMAVRGRDMTMITVIDPWAADASPLIQEVQLAAGLDLDHQQLELRRVDGTDRIAINESDQPWVHEGATCPAHDIIFTHQPHTT